MVNGEVSREGREGGMNLGRQRVCVERVGVGVVDPDLKRNDECQMVRENPTRADELNRPRR